MNAKILITVALGLSLIFCGAWGISYSLDTEDRDIEHSLRIDAHFSCPSAEEISVTVMLNKDGKAVTRFELLIEDNGDVGSDGNLMCDSIWFHIPLDQTVTVKMKSGEVINGKPLYEMKNVLLDYQECDVWEDRDCLNWFEKQFIVEVDGQVRSLDYYTRYFRAEISLDSDDGTFSRLVIIPDDFIPKAQFLEGYKSIGNGAWYEYFLGYNGNAYNFPEGKYQMEVSKYISWFISSEIESRRLKSIQQVVLIIASTLFGAGVSACIEAFLSSGIISAIRLRRKIIVDKSPQRTKDVAKEANVSSRHLLLRGRPD